MKILPSKLKGTIAAPLSKSHLHRLLIAAALAADTFTDICGISDAADVEHTRNCLNAMGAHIIQMTSVRVTPISLSSPVRNPTLDCGESGSTLRFLLPLAGALGGGTFTGVGRLPSRPTGELIDCMRRGGCTVTDGFPISVSGKLQPGEYVIDGGISSQFITGLLFALPLLDGDSHIVVKGETASVSYIGMTLAVLRLFGIKIEKKDNGYFVPGLQQYISPYYDGARGRYRVRIETEGDWSGAAFFLCAGALCGDVTVTGLNMQSEQGDKAIVDILKRMGAIIQYTAYSAQRAVNDMKECGAWSVECGVKDWNQVTNNEIKSDYQPPATNHQPPMNCSIRVRKSRLHALDIHAEDIPDLIPILSVVCGAAKGTSRIYGAERLRHKESDRLAAVMENLKILGIKTDYQPPTTNRQPSLNEGRGDKGGILYIHGGTLKGGDLNGYNDHRIVMSAAVALAASRNGGSVSCAEAVGKSYPGFFADFQKLGGQNA